MKRFSVLVLALFALLAGSTLSSVWSQDRPVPLRLGFIDIKKGFESYRKRSDVMEKLKTKGEAFKKQFKQREEEIEKDAGALNTLNPGSDEFLARERKINLEKYSLDMDKKLTSRALDNEGRRANALIYKEICQEAQVYGQERSLAAVLLYIPYDTDFETDLDIIVLTRAVLCRDDQLDVTDAVIQRLNAQLPPK